MANKFKKGDIIVGLKNHYGVTNEGWVGEVTKEKANSIIVKAYGKSITGSCLYDTEFEVNPKYFTYYKKSNMKQTIIGYKCTKSYPGGPVIGAEVGVNNEIAPLLPDCYTPIYKKTVESYKLTVGSNHMEVSIEENNIRANGHSFTRRELDKIRTYLKGLSYITTAGGYEISIKENWRFIRIGCTDEDHRVSMEELDAIIAKYDEINF